MTAKTRRSKINNAEGLSSPLDVAVSVQDETTMSMVRDAIANRRVRLAWQPVVLARDPSRVAFHEGLVRVLDPTGRVIPAKDFITAVEAHEIGREIDCLALAIGLEMLGSYPDLRISINMSARSIGYQRWRQVLKRGLAVAPTIGERLILEITESSAMQVPELVIAFMEELQRHGIAFALDDFGSGHTVIRHFKDFYFDILKIDGQFIRNMHEDPDNVALVGALLSIGQHFRMFTVAEAVEHPEEAQLLRQMGIDCMQGFLFGAATLRPEFIAKPLHKVS